MTERARKPIVDQPRLRNRCTCTTFPFEEDREHGVALRLLRTEGMSISQNLLVVAASISLGALGCADAKRPAQPSAINSGMQGPAPYAGPRGPALGGRRLYDPSTVETVRGQVVRLEQVPSRRGAAAGVHVLLKNSEGNLLSVHLGPSWFLEKRQFALAPGDELEATGSRVSWDGEVYLIARELTKGQAVLALRSAEGLPLWAGSNLGPPADRPCAAPTNDASGPLTDAEEQALRDALDDEYRAWATYDQVVQDFGAQRPFDHIRDAEARHIEALSSLFQRHGLEVPANPWPGRVPRYSGVREACQAAVQAEIDNVALYERLANSTTRQDLLVVFSNLQRASQERHKQAFGRCATGGPGPRWR